MTSLLKIKKHFREENKCGAETTEGKRCGYIGMRFSEPKRCWRHITPSEQLAAAERWVADVGARIIEAYRRGEIPWGSSPGRV